ncbi:sugar transferase [Psychroserpens sp.]|uniref:sugar transferase n=1 Tax=Psychroserpens sp. TaxID=2020870 RepID=UPI001B2CDA81|nr:sugar transferase [Psychroserpens sp.]MBO6605707.1 sugar transferase [Psychroserpens sp.]MBO6630442.1 sugar transferase [Psychroserpens sp.]MBO6652922.1 sugar transferase [Psychroserpens sp.]MBO6681306.1 sugar transferase [Psychroserpens sp.]MBO6749081.1 sugar transferase [Psychroserpens sp.]
MNILYIGKELYFTEEFLENSSIELIHKNSALEALKLLRSKISVDAIIAHYDLSGNDGLFFYEELKHEFNSIEAPCLLLFDEFNVEAFKRAFELGVDDCFVIPSTDQTKLIERIKYLYESIHDKESIGSIQKDRVNYKIPLSKRIFDIVTASMALIILSPILILTMLAIRLESKGKVYYIAKRVGRKTFDFYKLRSMRNGADKLLKELAETKNQYNNNEEVSSSIEMTVKCPRCSALPIGEYCSPLNYEGIEKICDYMYHEQRRSIQNYSSSFIKIVDDPRITRIGKFIRNTSIDELPQLINVIKGDMSLVGNRPLPVYEAELLTQDQMSKRFLAPAGITGLWQVELRGKGGDLSEEDRMNLDNAYADHFIGNNYSFWFDLKLLLRTVPALFQKSTV